MDPEARGKSARKGHQFSPPDKGSKLRLSKWLFVACLAVFVLLTMWSGLVRFAETTSAEEADVLRVMKRWTATADTRDNEDFLVQSQQAFFWTDQAAKLEEAERRREFQGDLRKNVVTNWSFKMVKGRGKGMVLQVSKSESNETAQSTEDAWEDSSTSDAENATVSMAARRLRGEARAPHKVASVPKGCGSPATNQYADVDTQCLYDSPTAQMWRASHAKGSPSGLDLECKSESHFLLDGVAVRWGPHHKVESAAQCCQACREHIPGPHIGGPYAELPCNAWAYCPEEVCFDVDAHRHTQGDCWLKFTEVPHMPEVNARGEYSAEFRSRHPQAPAKTPWVSGVLLPPGAKMTNGTWSPRSLW